jgi:hypothetical protein
MVATAAATNENKFRYFESSARDFDIDIALSMLRGSASQPFNRSG